MSAERPSESDLTALAAHLHVQLRRRTGRVTDVEWMVMNGEYAQMVISLAKAAATTEGVPELAVWAGRFEMALAKYQRPRKPLMSALAVAGAKQHDSHPSSMERQFLPKTPPQSLESQMREGIVSEFGDSSRTVDTSELPSRKPAREAYVWSLR